MQNIVGKYLTQVWRYGYHTVEVPIYAWKYYYAFPNSNSGYSVRKTYKIIKYKKENICSWYKVTVWAMDGGTRPWGSSSSDNPVSIFNFSIISRWL